MKFAHNYNPDTGAHTSSTPADPDELETAKGEGEVYLLPAHATWVAPPVVPDGIVNVFDVVSGTWDQVEATSAPTETGQPAPNLDDQRAAAVRRVDSDVDATIFAVIGNRAAEYLTAEQEATSFLERLAADPNTDVPPSVTSDMQAFEHNAIEAAESILAQAAAWRGASNSMRAARLKAKQDIGKAGDVETLATRVQEWVAYINGMRAALGV